MSNDNTQNLNTPLRSLTAKEKKVLEFIEDFIGAQGISPSYKEIKDHFGFASFNSVQRYLKQLQNKEYIYIPPGNQKRAISLLQPSQSMKDFIGNEAPTSESVDINNNPITTTQNPFLTTQKFKKETSYTAPPVAESLSLPLLGRVAAGQPIEALENGEFVDVPPSMIRNPDKTFALKVEGQSMIDDGILDGDVIFVQEQNRASNGDTIVAVVENEATVKRFYFHQHKKEKQTHQAPLVELRPANTSMDSFWLDPNSVEIRGVVVGLLRKM